MAFSSRAVATGDNLFSLLLASVFARRKALHFFAAANVKAANGSVEEPEISRAVFKERHKAGDFARRP